MNTISVKTKFGEANKAYKQYRPTYPERIIEIILNTVAEPYKKAVDIGAGTGISTKLLSSNFENVIAIEPDKKMLDNGTFEDNVITINDCVENVRLKKCSIDLVTAGNSFYWMQADITLERIHEWLKENGVLAAYRYNLPKTNDLVINKIISEQSDSVWDRFRDDRLRDTGYTYRTIKNSMLFRNITITNVTNIVKLSPEEIVGFFSSTSYLSAYLASINDSEGYLTWLLNKIKRNCLSEKIDVDFSVELILAKKK